MSAKIMIQTILRLPSRSVLIFAVSSVFGVMIGDLSAVSAEPVHPKEIVVDFSRDISPILADKCFACHGPDAKHREADLRLDLEDAAKEDAIVPGKPDESELIARIMTADAEERMPPVKSGKTLSDKERQLLRRWISQGAKYEKHWAFERLVMSNVPQVKDTKWIRNDIDRFVLSRLESSRLHPSPRATRETLIRRVTLDLTGLPPTLKEIDDFLADKSENAFETVVDRLLQSPHYGERMAVDWLDGARFADSNGYQNDFGRSMWPWRDWVIRAYNKNMPFDQFTLEQVAGDLLPNASLSQKVATGFYRNGRSVTEGGSIEEEWHVESVVDRVETTSIVFLGLTMGCCRCHDHKYDPISQKEFYRFFAFLNSNDERGTYIETRGNVPPLISVPQPEDQRRLAEYDATIKAAKLALQKKAKNFDQLVAMVRKGLPDARPLQKESVPLLRLPLDGTLNVSLRNDRDKTEADYKGGEPQWIEGVIGNSLLLGATNNSYVDAGQVAKLDRGSAFTFSAWVRPDRNGAILSKMDSDADYRGYDLLLLKGGQLKIHLVHKWPDDAIAVTTKASLEMGTWTHVCVTYDGSSKASGLRVYISGQSTPVDVNSDKLTNSFTIDQPLRIGRRSKGDFFKGAVADVRVYDQALPADAIQQQVNLSLTESIQAVEKNGDQRNTRRVLLEKYFAANDHEHMEAKRLLAKLQKERANVAKKIPTVMIMKERATPRPTYLLKRGQYDAPDKSELLKPGVPSFLPELPEGAPRNRLGLAKWMIDPSNPLVSRVAVNRLWAMFFGLGIVKSTENFGLQSTPPSHPKLLDYLAMQFIKSGWDVKALQKQIVMSATYRQSSVISPKLGGRDPDNRLLSRGSRFRMSAEMLRDNALVVSGLLVRKVGGPSVKPYQPARLWKELAGGASQGAYVQDHGDSLYRRSLYTYRKRTVPHTTLGSFDSPTFEICQVKRGTTNTPLHALALLNDVTYVEAARNLAQRMLGDVNGTSAERLRYGFRLATGRYPTAKGLAVLESSLARHLKTYQNDFSAVDELLKHGESPISKRVRRPELAAFMIVATIILNLDETITRE